MTGVHYDTFEDEVAISKMIDSLQSKTIDYMSQKDSLDVKDEKEWRELVLSK